jgi:hypothetical protein
MTSSSLAFFVFVTMVQFGSERCGNRIGVRTLARRPIKVCDVQAQLFNERIDGEMRVPALAIIAALADVLSGFGVVLAANLGERKYRCRNELRFR